MLLLISLFTGFLAVCLAMEASSHAQTKDRLKRALDREAARTEQCEQLFLAVKRNVERMP